MLKSYWVMGCGVVGGPLVISVSPRQGLGLRGLGSGLDNMYSIHWMLTAEQLTLHCRQHS